jgi:hypothetical protein
MTGHVGIDQLRRFARGQGTAAENCQVVMHLMHECGLCVAVVQEVLHPKIPEGAYDEPFDRILAQKVSEQRLRSIGLPWLGEL